MTDFFFSLLLLSVKEYLNRMRVGAAAINILGTLINIFLNCLTIAFPRASNADARGTFQTIFVQSFVLSIECVCELLRLSFNKCLQTFINIL
jgi:hypothetical protein